MQTVFREEIKEALVEAVILESAFDNFDVDNVLKVACKLSNAPFCLVLKQYNEKDQLYVTY